MALVVVVVVLVEVAGASVVVVAGAVFVGSGAVVTGRTPGVCGAVSSFAGALVVLVAGADLEVEVEVEVDGGLMVAGLEAAGFEPGGGVGTIGRNGVGVTEGVGGIGTCPAAKLNAASDSATKQTERSTRFM